VPAYVSVTQGGFSFEFVFQRLSSKDLVSFSGLFFVASRKSGNIKSTLVGVGAGVGVD
jgi:hypothetical protein